jgi:hypothetical protein
MDRRGFFKLLGGLTAVAGAMGLPKLPMPTPKFLTIHTDHAYNFLLTRLTIDGSIVPLRYPVEMRFGDPVIILPSKHLGPVEYTVEWVEA